MASDYKSIESSNEPPKSKKMKMLMPVDHRFSTALDYTTYRLTERSLYYEDQVTRHVTIRHQVSVKIIGSNEGAGI